MCVCVLKNGEPPSKNSTGRVEILQCQEAPVQAQFNATVTLASRAQHRRYSPAEGGHEGGANSRCRRAVGRGLFGVCIGCRAWWLGASYW